MNDFKKLLLLTNENKNKLNELYQNLDNDIVKSGLKICKFKGLISQKIAILRRVVDLKTDPLVTELEKDSRNKQEISNIKDEMYNFTLHIHENLHKDLINRVKCEKILDEFHINLLQGVHKIGIILNKIHLKWQHKVDKNSEIFSKMQDPFEFIKTHDLYQKSPRGEICDRIYGIVEFLDDSKSAIIVPYAKAFDEFYEVENEFNNLIKSLKSITNTAEEKDYINYIEKLKIAFLQDDNDKMIESWREAEMAWMDVKSPLQIGHPLEYYEDAYTHSVALEWDIRLKDECTFDEDKFKENVKSSFDNVYKKIGAKDNIMHSLVFSNIDKTQLYISTPMIYYGAELDGLFSAQVVPNDEFVSSNCGKKIFAFINFVYESAVNKPFMKIASEIFDKNFLDYGREILFKKPEVWKKVYQISTIGHEFGHILFISEDTENRMNKSGKFKFIEEYKATTGGLVNFFLHEEEDMKLPVFSELIRRSIGLIAWQEVSEVKAYYCESLIHLTLLFKSKTLKFKDGKLKVNFDMKSYENFKNVCFENYVRLAQIYLKRADANEFLSQFCSLEDEVYLPKDKETKEFVQYYFKLHKEIGNEVDQSDEAKQWQRI